MRFDARRLAIDFGIAILLSSTSLFIAPKTVEYGVSTAISSSALADINTRRAIKGRSQLIQDPRLCETAAAKAQEIIARRQFGHDFIETLPETTRRIPWTNFIDLKDYSAFGENLAANVPVSNLGEAWDISTSHKTLQESSLYTRGCVVTVTPSRPLKAVTDNKKDIMFTSISVLHLASTEKEVEEIWDRENKK